MPHPERWRDTCDPFALPYRTFRPTEILGYPHAGNDVFHARGCYLGAPVTAYIKVARQRSTHLGNEMRLLRQLNAPCFPTVLDGDEERGSFSVTAELPGNRLPVILGEHHASTALPYMEAYGEALAINVLWKAQRGQPIPTRVAAQKIHRKLPKRCVPVDIFA